MPSQAQDRPSSTTDPGDQFTTEQANITHAPEPEAEQLALRFFAVINGYNRIPPERALWRELLKTAITSSAAFVIHHRKVTPALVHHVALEIYFHANAAGVAHLPQDQLAEYCHRPQASVSRALAVLERLRIIRRNRTSRRDAEIIEMNLGGLSWPAIRMRAKQARRMDQATTSRLNFEQPASLSDGMVPSLSYGTMPSPKGYVPGLGTDQITAAARTVRAREADERQQQQQQQQQRPTQAPDRRTDRRNRRPGPEGRPAVRRDRRAETPRRWRDRRRPPPGPRRRARRGDPTPPAPHRRPRPTAAALRPERTVANRHRDADHPTVASVEHPAVGKCPSHTGGIRLTAELLGALSPVRNRPVRNHGATRSPRARRGR